MASGSSAISSVAARHMSLPSTPGRDRASPRSFCRPAETIWQTATAASSTPPALSRKSSTTACAPCGRHLVEHPAKLRRRMIAEERDPDVCDSRIGLEPKLPTPVITAPIAENRFDVDNLAHQLDRVAARTRACVG